MSQRIAVVRHQRPGVDEQVALVEREARALGGEVLGEEGIDQADVVLVLGGDGTMLKAAELVRGRPVPVFGVNFGHVGFLAEADPASLQEVVRRLVAGDYEVDERLAVAIAVTHPDGSTEHGWALNEAALTKLDRARMLEVAFGVDGHAVSSFGCDGMLLATPTGSTAYAFSLDGPVVWPDVQALLVVPVAAHALFARPLVVDPDSVVEVEIRNDDGPGGEIWCDGRRVMLAPPGSRVTVTRADEPVLLARMSSVPFSGRLVAKFDLPVRGWREARRHA